MKKFLTIVLISVILFQSGGYYILYWCLRLHADGQLKAYVEADAFKKSETFEVKIPITVPYPLQAQGYQRAHGAFEHNGEFFRIVKQKFEGDTLFVLCIRDHRLKQIENSLAHVVSESTSLQEDQHPLHAWTLLQFSIPLATVKEEGTGGYFSVLLRSAFTPELISCSMPVLAPPPRA